MKKKKQMAGFPIIIEWSEEDACFVAHTPAIKYCTALGDTYEEAAREMHSAIEGWLEIARERGTPIPAPGPTIAELTDVAPLLNVKEIARRSGISEQTLYAKVRRGSPLRPEESSAIAITLSHAGVHLFAEKKAS